ncbi:MAG: L-glutamate gamma-semialdehyde dehydrogenase [Mariprofundaceae bacterium]|nr:L-glutamate gamma-semialdehyde dehydrogenase [Mariprofundaceae bacterium]
MSDSQKLQQHTEAIGRDLLARAKRAIAEAPAGEQWLRDFMRRLGEDERFRVQALRFIDVLPALSDDRELARHLLEYFAGGDFPLPNAVQWGIRHAGAGLLPHMVAPAVRKAVEWIGRRFIAGETADEAFRVIEKLHEQGMQTSLDLLGEAVLSEAEADAYQRQYLELISSLAPRLEKCGRQLHLSIKISSLYSQITPIAPEHGADAIRERLRPILKALRQHNGAITLDMEHFDIRHIILRVFRDILMESDFRDWADAGIAMQAYLKNSEQKLDSLIRWARERGTPVHVRLVRGAYWDMETIIARREGWPCPVWEEKWQTDQCYERCLEMLIGSHDCIRPAIASHNVRSLALAMALLDEAELADSAYEFQMLYGMAEPLQHALTGMGQPLRIYVPAGPIIPGMAYLVRRLLENSTSASFLRMAFIEGTDEKALLAPPEPADQKAETSGHGFRIEPAHRFTDAAGRDAFAEAIHTVRNNLGGHDPLIIGEKRVETERRIVSVNPACPDQIVGTVAAAGTAEADAAVASALKAWPAWRQRGADERVDILHKAASMLHARRDEFAAWQVFEAGKPWREADADVTEAIDYLHYYAAEAERLATGRWMNVAGETNLHAYIPRGVAAVIPPWNFPLAIACGMLSAAIACGNTAILKPSSQTPVIAARFVQLLLEAGVPEGVIHYLPADGATVGEYLVTHPDVHIIAFTGSREVGCRIRRLAAEHMNQQKHVRKVIAEMGGKNAIIVDADTDLDDAVAGIVTSAFGYAGQKCSACSRLIAVGGIYNELMERLVHATESIVIGPPERPETFMGPVISAAAQARIRTAIDKGRQAASLVHATDVNALGDGFYIGPAIFTDVDPASSLAQEEIFGPVLAVMRANDFDTAIEMANGTRYALTGGVYSRSPAHLKQAAENFEVGNLYLNRKITGAIVARQPFGGFRMSGTGAKAGGPDYLLQFVHAKTVTENTLRRGFAPNGGS